MENYDLRLALVDGEPTFVSEEAPSGAEDSTFRLCHKPVEFGRQQFEYWWMDIRTIYRSSRRPAANFDPLIDFWWDTCRAHGSNVDPSVCESYLLAKLFERTRERGSRNVLLDSIPKRGNVRDRQQIVVELEAMLAQSFDDENTILQFQRNTANFIGPPNYEPGVSELVEEFCEQLFENSVAQLIEGAESEAMESALQVWQQWDKRFGRRTGNELQKQAMDILSYEARPTIHRAYSHLWEVVSNWLCNEFSTSNDSLVFHQFWHLDLHWPSNECDNAAFHLFHGHIFALHPATPFFVQTETGSRLLGDWLAVTAHGWEYRPHPETPELCRLLHGLEIAICDYSNRHVIAQTLRKGSEHIKFQTDDEDTDRNDWEAPVRKQRS